MIARTTSKGFWKYIWLALGCILFGVTGLAWNVPIAAWLSPLFLIRFFRSEEGLRRMLLAVPLLTLAAFAKFHGGWDLTLPGEFAFSFLLAAPTLIALSADRVFARHIPGIAAVLVYPAVFTALDYLIGLAPVGTSLSVSVSQFGSLPLNQLASVTGIWGITFLIGWFASTANALWERDFAARNALRPASFFAAAAVLTLTFGGLRLAALRPDSPTVRIGGVSVPQPSDYWTLIIDRGTPEDVARQYDAEFSTLEDALFAASERAAGMQAKVIFWAEANAVLHPDGEAAFLERARAFARAHKVYLMPALLVLQYGGAYAENKVVMIEPDGEIAFTYEKTYSWYDSRSDGLLHTVDTPYGRISAAICFDMDFPHFIRQAARQDVDIMLVPAFDWEQIKSFHTQVGLFRGIEGGFSVMRQTNTGTSVAADYQGRLLAYQDFFLTTDRVLLADVPTQGVRTFYGLAGDWFAYLTILYSAGLILWGVWKHSRPVPSSA